MIKVNNKAMCELLNADIEYMMKHCNCESLEVRHIIQILHELLYKYTDMSKLNDGAIDRVAYLKESIARQIVDDIFFGKTDAEKMEGYTEDDMVKAMYTFLESRI